MMEKLTTYTFSHNHGSVQNYPNWKETIILEIHPFSTEPWLWEEGYIHLHRDKLRNGHEICMWYVALCPGMTSNTQTRAYVRRTHQPKSCKHPTSANIPKQNFWQKPVMLISLYSCLKQNSMRNTQTLFQIMPMNLHYFGVSGWTTKKTHGKLKQIPNVSFQRVLNPQKKNICQVYFYIC